MLPIVVLLSSLLLTVAPERVTDGPVSYIKTTKIECRMYPEFIANLSCTLKPVSREKAVVSVFVNFIKPVNNMTMNMSIYRKETRYLPFLVNITRNFCEMSRGVGLDFYTKVVMLSLKKFSNQRKCPIFGEFRINDAFLDTKWFAVALPTGEYQVRVNFTDGFPPMKVVYLSGNVDVVRHRNRGPLKKIST